jgi:hypothetical protein
MPLEVWAARFPTRAAVPSFESRALSNPLRPTCAWERARATGGVSGALHGEPYYVVEHMVLESTLRQETELPHTSLRTAALKQRDPAAR